MKVVFISKSDTTGGAAVVTLRIAEALRNIGIEASIITAEKLSGRPFVHLGAPKWRIRMAFILERLRVWMANGFTRHNLFAADAAAFGLPLWRNQMVKKADVICLEWFNQGLLSLKGIKKLSALGKPIVWVMHDQWAMTGVCHLPGTCRNYKDMCGSCPILHSHKNTDLSRSVFLRKQALYRNTKLQMVAVSRYLKQAAAASPLLGDIPCEVIPNPFDIQPRYEQSPAKNHQKIVMVMGAARLDEPGKGLQILLEALAIIARDHAELAERLELVTYGDIRNPQLLESCQVAHRHLGVIKGDKAINRIYAEADIVVSPSHYESLPTTLVEGMAHGCVGVAFNRGGQGDIITHGTTGILVDYYDEYANNPQQGGEAFSEGIIRGVDMMTPNLPYKITDDIYHRFASSMIARRYRTLFETLVDKAL